MGRISREDALHAYQVLGRLLRDVYSVGEQELAAGPGITVPASIFTGNLPPFSALATHLHSHGMEAKEIARRLRRNRTFVASAIKEERLPEGGTPIPIDAFAGKLSVLEAAAHHLRQRGKSNKEISEELGRTPSAVWTLMKRADGKLGGVR